jgi:hypothetical protein
MKQAVMTEFRARNQPDTFDKDLGIQFGSWCEFTDAKEDLTLPALACFADMNHSAPALLPKEFKPDLSTGFARTIAHLPPSLTADAGGFRPSS